MTESLRIDEPLVRRAERLYAGMALLLVVFLHIVGLVSSGALWRDEIHSVNMSLTGSWSEIWKNLGFESFPVGWFVILRPIAHLVGPDADFAYRVFGLVPGLLLVLVVTLAGIRMTGRPPLIAINLVLANAVVIRFGDSLRGYGLGMLSAAGTYWALWHYANRRDRPSALIALAAASISVQMAYHNAPLVFGACVAASVACMLRGSHRAAAGAIAIGAGAAATLVPYAPVIRQARNWNDLVRFDIGIEWIHRMGAWSIAHSGVVSLVLWYAALALGLVVAASVAFGVAKRRATDPARAFHAVALTIGGGAYVAFLLKLGYYMAPWYYLALMVFAAMAADALLASVVRGSMRLVTLLVLLAHLALSLGPVSRYVMQPSTNVPAVAAELATLARADDLILITPWEVGISWKRYADVQARWTTVPPIDFLEWHRYDLLYPQIDSPAAVEPLIRLVDETLEANRRVLLVSLQDYPTPPGAQPRPLTRVGDPAWRLNDYLQTDRFRIERWPRLDDTIGYERTCVLEVHLAGARR